MPTRVVTVAGDPELEAQLAEQLDRGSAAELYLRCVERIDLLASIRAGDLDGIVCAGLPSWFDAETAEEAGSAGIRVVVLTDDPLSAERLRRHGGVTLAPTATIETILTAILSDPSPEPVAVTPQAGGRVVAVWGPKGSPGRTRVAVEVAALLARSPRDTLLVDGDPYGGDVLQLLGIVDSLPTVIWAARSAARQEGAGAWLGRELKRATPGGPMLLPGLPRGDLWPEVSDRGWERLLACARAELGVVVVDVGFCLEPQPSHWLDQGEGRNGMTRTSLRAAETVIAVCRADPIGIKNFMWSWDPLTELVDPARVLIAVNRVLPGQEAEVRDLLARNTGRPPAVLLPDRPREVASALFSGRPVTDVKPRSDLTRALADLAARLGGRVQRRGVLTRLAGVAR